VNEVFPQRAATDREHHVIDSASTNQHSNSVELVKVKFNALHYTTFADHAIEHSFGLG